MKPELPSQPNGHRSKKELFNKIWAYIEHDPETGLVKRKGIRFPPMHIDDLLKTLKELEKKYGGNKTIKEIVDEIFDEIFKSQSSQN
ncbi:MAG: hypothetical protein C4347_00275 [Patescibacteria group bacterium]